MKTKHVVIGLSVIGAGLLIAYLCKGKKGDSKSSFDSEDKSNATAGGRRRCDCQIGKVYTSAGWTGEDCSCNKAL